MNESECLSRMQPPGAFKPKAYGHGVIQILVTSMCEKSCFSCTQSSNVVHKKEFMPLRCSSKPSSPWRASTVSEVYSEEIQF